MLCVVTRMDLTLAHVKLDILEMAVLAVVRFSFVDITRPQNGGRRGGGTIILNFGDRWGAYSKGEGHI